MLRSKTLVRCFVLAFSMDSYSFIPLSFKCFHRRSRYILQALEVYMKFRDYSRGRDYVAYMYSNIAGEWLMAIRYAYMI